MMGRELIDRLAGTHSLSTNEYRTLLEAWHADDTGTLSAYAAKQAVSCRKAVYGNAVFIRGLIEISNVCKNDCRYCGIRRSNRDCSRYRLTPEEILACCEAGYALGFRTFVLQGGEDPYYTDELLGALIGEIHRVCPDAAVTLSLGERGRESFRRLYEAGAERYLLRHETADETHYRKLHPEDMSYVNRMRCLQDLKDIGYRTGCGFMVGSPGQTFDTLAKDLKFIEDFAPEMCGIGPFIPHPATPFAGEKAGSVDLTCFLLSVIRLIRPNVLLPATTALGTLAQDGTVRGILAGANVVMPNLSPMTARRKYELYEKKAITGSESAEGLEALKQNMEMVGYEVVVHRGDIRN